MSFQDPDKLTTNGRTFRKWTKQDLALLRKLHPNTPNEVLAKRLRKTLKALASKACLLGLKKSKRRLTQMGHENQAKRKDLR